MRKIAIASIVLVLAAVAAPVYAGGLGGGTHYQSEHVEVQTDVGYVHFGHSTQFGGDIVVAVWSGPDWFRCASYGDDVASPSLQRQGNHRIRVSGSFTEADFDQCWGSPEAWDISFDFVVEADVVTISDSKGTYKEKVLRGGDEATMEDAYHQHSMNGRDVTATGTIFGSPITTTEHGEFGEGYFKSAG